MSIFRDWKGQASLAQNLHILSILQWLHQVCALAMSMEILGTSKVQIIFMVSNPK
jgi:hypothetical protein